LKSKNDSRPGKTADIEVTLVQRANGPRAEMLVVIAEDFS